MTVRSLEHVGVVVDDLDAAVAFFVALGLELEGSTTVEGDVVDRIVALDGVRSDIAILVTPDGHGKLELARFVTPPGPDGDPQAPSNAPGIRHILFTVDDIEAAIATARAHGGELVGELMQYGTSYKLCYVRGPAGIIVEFAEKLG